MNPTIYRQCIALICFCFSALQLFASGIEITDLSYDAQTDMYTVIVKRDYAFFYNDRHDAALLHFKYDVTGNGTWKSAQVDLTQSFNTCLNCNLANNAYNGYTKNVIGYPPVTDSVWVTRMDTFELALLDVEYKSLADEYDLKVFAIEMVNTAAGSFEVGDGYSNGRFYQSGNVDEPMVVLKSNDDNGKVRGNASGQFDQVNSPNTENITAGYPMGYYQFYAMKYKITAEQYVDFLNCLDRVKQNTRTESDLSGTSLTNVYVMSASPTVTNRNPIRCNSDIGAGRIEFYCDLNGNGVPNEVDDGQNIVLNYLSAADIMAYGAFLDMRIMSELEFEKVARGSLLDVTVPGEFAWGTLEFNFGTTITNAGTATESYANVGVDEGLLSFSPVRAGYAATPTSTRTFAGAGFTGCMDLHNLGELMISVEDQEFESKPFYTGLTPLGEAKLMEDVLYCLYSDFSKAISEKKIDIGLQSRLPLAGGRLISD